MSATSVRRMATTLLRDGRMSTTDAQKLLTEARRDRRLDAAEKAALKSIYDANKSKFDPGAKAAFERALGVLEPPTPPVTPPTPPVTPPTPPATGPEVAEYKAGHKPWTTTYWPMAGSGPEDEGSPSSNLWAKGGPLEKFDALLKARGGNAGALAEERVPALNWMVGKDTGNYIPSSTLREADAERTTGVDFNRDGKITADVKHDFLDGYGNFGTDGKTEGSMSVGWWGSCDKVASAGTLFKEPTKDVTLDGVTFTAQDIKGLLVVIADSQGGGSEFEGNRYDREQDSIQLRNGQTIRGRISTPFELWQTGMSRWGDNVTVPGDKLPDELSVQLGDGTTKTIKKADIRSVSREDTKDDPVLFHETIKSWLSGGRPAVMDKDSGDHVWNYSFWKATDKTWKDGQKPDWANDFDPAKAVGFNGPTTGGKIVFVERDVALAGGDYGPNYRYWMEEKNGKFVNGGWMSDNPDFLWRPANEPTWRGANPRNSFVDPAIVKELYDKSIEP